MSSTYGRLAAIRDYWMPRDTSARIEVRVTDLDEVLRELVRVTTISADQHAAKIKLLGALDMVRETLKGGEIDDLLYIINNAIAAADAGSHCGQNLCQGCTHLLNFSHVFPQAFLSCFQQRPIAGVFCQRGAKGGNGFACAVNGPRLLNVVFQRLQRLLGGFS